MDSEFGAPDSPPLDQQRQAQVVVRGVSYSFGTGDNCVQAVKNANLTLMPAELVAITGPSGSGKTTLLTLMGALRTLQQGSIEFQGQELSARSSFELTKVRQNIGFIFQQDNLFESLTAFHNVRIALELKKYTASSMRKATIEILTRLGLSNRLHHKPRQLSGGQRQRVAIARALVNRPRLILADEPTAALDQVSTSEVMQVLKELVDVDGCTVLIVTHDNRIIESARRTVNMDDGHITSEILVEDSVAVREFLALCPVFQNGSQSATTAHQGAVGPPANALTCSPTLLAEMAQKMKTEKYSAGTSIVREGEESDKFYIIRDGSVEVRQPVDGDFKVLATLSRGDHFVGSDFTRNHPRNVAVVARHETVVYSLSRPDFFAAGIACGTFDDGLYGTMLPDYLHGFS